MDPETSFPKAVISRIVVGAISDATAAGTPKSAISSDAKDALNTAGITFVNYITHLALDEAAKAKRSTVSAADVTAALSAGGFQDWVGGLEGQLAAAKEAKSKGKDSAGLVQTTL